MLIVKRIGLALAMGVLAGVASAQETSWDGLWKTTDGVPAEHEGAAWVRPLRFQGAELNLDAMKTALRPAPLEGTPEAVDGPVVITLPTPDGFFMRFHVVESPIMEPGLAAQLPGTKTYLGQGIDDPAATLRADVTPAGFHAQVLSPEGNYWIDPYTRDNTVFYASYRKSDLGNKPDWTCTVVGDRLDPNFAKLRDRDPRASGATRKQYRLCVAATGEYTAFHGGTVTAGQNAIVTAVNRVNGVYELECAIRMVLIANNSSVVYTNSSTDPYTNSDGGSMLSQNQSTLTSVIGSANYDMGHVFSTGGGGIAGLGVVCGGSKAWGVTGSGSPTGDAFWIDYVAHEMGHQFGANHNFNGTLGACSGNRNASTAYEPGSGNSIMSYAGICSSDNLQAHSDAYFNHQSYVEIQNFITTGTGNNCDAPTATGNNAPVVNAGPDYTIPANTPFTLTGSATDADGDALSYQWDQRNLGAAQSASGGIIADNGTSPFIRGWNAVTSPSRVIPRVSNLLANTFVIGERLPITNRTMTFRLTARDNRAGNGGINWDDMVVTSTTSAGPFTVTSPNTNVLWSGNQTITWNVTNTNVAPVNCANVKILLSTDGGNTWPTTLLASTPNDGSEVVTLPSITTTTARIKVEAVGNIFFDISNVNFRIQPGTPPDPTGVTATPSNACSGQLVQLSANSPPAGHVIDWFTGSCGGTLVGTGTTINVNPTTTTLYYARTRRSSDNVNSTNCGSASVTITPAPAAATSAEVDRTNFCFSDDGTISLSVTGGSGDFVRWFADSCASSSLGTGNPLVIASPEADTTYYARWENVCGVTTCVSVPVNVIDPDLNNDGFTDALDYDAFVAAWLASDLFADYNGDEFTDAIDYDLFINDWLNSGC